MRPILTLFLIFISHQILACPAEDPEEKSYIGILERAHDLLDYRLNAAANRLDSFFATQRADDELGRSQLRLRGGYQVRENSLPAKTYQFRFNLKLPHLEEKFRPKKRKKTSENSHQPSQIVDEQNKLNTHWIFRSDIGVISKLPLPALFARSRLRKSFQTGTIIHRFAEQAGYFTDRGVLEETDFDSDQTINDDLIFRLSHRKDWDILRKTFRTVHGPRLLHKINEISAFSYNFFISSTINDSIWYVDNYQFSPAYRRDMYRNWLFMDIVPGLDFPKSYSFKRTPFISIQIEALFGT
ncbi:MAG: hypothetical protein AB7I27_06715 [Bacteriovoracaceae bacterium]